MTTPLGYELLESNWITPWPALDATIAAIGHIIVYGAVAVLVAYAMLFGRPASQARRTLAILSIAVLASCAAVYVAQIAGTWNAWIDPETWILANPYVLATIKGVVFLVPLVGLVAAGMAADGSERARLVWAMSSIATYIVLTALNDIGSELGSKFLSGVTISNVAVFLLPLGITYSLFGRRLLDVEFALNRAVVFTVVSLVVVGSFSLAEWALGGWLQHASNVTNAAVSAALALALGLSIYPIQRRVDRIVDTVVFRERYEAERALHRFTNEAAFITNADTVIERATALLERHVRTATVEFVVFDGDRTYGDLSENDEALVSLRASHDVVDLHEVATALVGEFAIPMLARGRLIGALLLGPKRLGGSYSPDEMRAVVQLTHGVAVAIDLIALQRSNSGTDLSDDIRALRATNHEIAESLTALRQLIGDRLFNRKSEI